MTVVRVESAIKHYMERCQLLFFPPLNVFVVAEVANRFGGQRCTNIWVLGHTAVHDLADEESGRDARLGRTF